MASAPPPPPPPPPNWFAGFQTALTIAANQINTFSATVNAAVHNLNIAQRTLNPGGPGGAGGGPGGGGLGAGGGGRGWPAFWRGGLRRARRAIRAGRGLRGAAGGFFRGGLRAAGVTGRGALAGAGAAIGLFTAAVAAAAAVAQRMSTEQQRYTERLAQSSPGMAMVAAEREMRETLRDMEKGNRLAGAARGLMTAEQQAQDNTKEIEILWERVKYWIAEKWEGVKGAVAKPFNEIARAINQTAENTNPANARRDISMGEWLEEVAQDARRMEERGQDRKPDFGDPFKVP